jgi:hypothetical protein
VLTPCPFDKERLSKRTLMESVVNVSLVSPPPSHLLFVGALGVLVIQLLTGQSTEERWRADDAIASEQ